MPYNENLADRLREAFLPYQNQVEEKNMFGGLTFMYKGKMCCGIIKDELMVRVIESKLSAVLEQNYVRPMDFTKRPMKGFIFVEEGGVKSNQELQNWVSFGIEHVESQLSK
ncbi:MAG: TfoX/Sxy family protein [Cyclobacteriaceae bacterium]|nr:TfoX/Sxy family protein [Cyclobacteriaceae bacterium]